MMIRTLGIVLAIAGMTAHHARAQSLSVPTGIDPAKAINVAVEQAWQANKQTPTSRCDDATFARRSYLDLIGRIPNSDELSSFVKDCDSRKRSRLIDSLLHSSEYSQHMAQVFDAIFMGRTDLGGMQRRAEVGWTQYLEDVFAKNRPWNEVVEELLLARPATREQRGAVWYLVSRNDKHQEMAEAVSKDLFGVRIDCAQCHNHPLADEIHQAHYWGLVAFFNRSKNCDTPWGKGLGESAIGGFSEFANVEGESQPNELVYLDNKRVAEARPAKDAKEQESDDLYHASVDGQPRIPKFSRRAKFVEEIAKNNPLIAKAFVNRIWGWMLGRGVVHPVDAMDSYHPASHPELLDWLSRDFASSGYDIRRLIRAIALSDVYQLDSSKAEFVDPQWFAHGHSKPLTAEMLHRSWLVVFQPDDAGRWESLQVRTELIKSIPDVMVEEPQANVAQGLLLTNGELLNQLVDPRNSKFIRQLAENSDDSQCLDQLFMRCLGREPQAAEKEECLRWLRSTTSPRSKQLSSLAWALVTSAEFRFNH